MSILRYLKTLAAVERHGTFAAAAEHVGLTQSAVSVQMRKLEETLGVALFDRSGRAVVLTEAGRRTLGHAAKIVQLFTQMSQGVSDEDLTGTLRAGGIMTVLLGDAVDSVAMFRQRYPNVDLHLTPGGSIELLTLVEKGRLDCALIVKPPHPIEGALRWRSLRQEPFVLLTAPGEASTDIEWLLTRQPFIRYDRHSHGGSLVERFLKRKRYAPDEALETDSIEMICLLVARHAGVAIVPRTPMLDVLAVDVREIDLGSDVFHREIGLVERVDNPNAHLVGDFWTTLRVGAMD